MIIPSNERCAYYFEQICQFPHGSKNEKQLSDYLVAFAKEHNLRYLQDEMYNVVIYKPASVGYEASEPVLIQAHMDMVDEKNADSDHDFTKDPLALSMEDGWVKAKGTTLGADDGMGVAFMLGILEDPALKHPALECAFTVQEEIGLFGAANLKKEYFKAHNYICLDGGGEYTTLISSAGGRRAYITKQLPVSPNSDCGFVLKIRGLKGGHSGGNIDKELGNSNKLATRILYHVSKAMPIRIASINGGLKDNAIPRECDVVFSVAKEHISELKAIVTKETEAIKTLLEFSDEGFTASLSEATMTSSFGADDSAQLIKFLYLLPNGLVAKSMKIPGLTLTSLNMGVTATKGDKVEIHFSLRSAINESIDEMANQISELCELFGYDVTYDASYPGWNYKEENPLRDKFMALFEEKYGYPMKTVAAHGGCECGIFDSLLSPVNILSYGAITEAIHTPEERLNLESFERCYNMLKELLTRLQ